MLRVPRITLLLVLLVLSAGGRVRGDALAAGGEDPGGGDYVAPDALLEFGDYSDDRGPSDGNSVQERSSSFVSRSQFPYCRCGRGTNNNPYQLVLTKNVSLANGRSQFCFTLAPSQNCDALDPGQRPGMCCREVQRQLHKIHLEADPQCRGSIRGASVNNGSKAWLWEADTGPSAGLKLTGLALNSTQASATEVCFTLSPPCATINQLCHNEATCRACSARPAAKSAAAKSAAAESTAAKSAAAKSAAAQPSAA
ncbi:hypothetical protein GPECTOR_9g650 [Gonium pectorale]|uniref:Pherophorin domain-containing protein n=1 Tax=Gonium pectorale TaxID=33097 RepID=A0A150GRX4_GONPE|nr:hypothetical protein GPECTOR_9g650 [Gonium pectorale]|eukprot:KXZ52605.1 hypothetical protein GPECTOR_9g650 [Gonium pectorale]